MLETFTFVLTDIEGSTRLWEQDANAMRRAMQRHDELIAQAAAQFNGLIKGERGEGDSRFIIFTQPIDAIHTAAMLQDCFQSEPWDTVRPIKIRIGIHTGQAQQRDNDFYGSDVNRCARIRALGHGGQILVSRTTHDFVIQDLSSHLVLRDLGTHRLKDLARPEQIYQLEHTDAPLDFPPLASLNALPNNLPIELTSFVGRAQEIEQLAQQLDTAHLITLVGTGGCGKSRLALHLSAQMLERFPDGVWFIELAPLTESPQVARAVAQAINLRQVAGITLEQILIDYLSPRASLIILDNCEHLIPASAQLATDLLLVCPRLKILATSRQPLGIAGEVAFRVPSLTLPDPRDALLRERLMQSDSARLFIERAQAARANWQVSNPQAIAQICKQLDGIPLALELAAPRVRVMTVEQIAQHLATRFDLLSGGSRTALPRQQTMRALIDWSYDLLSPAEKIFLQQFSVFSGGASLDAIQAVCIPIDPAATDGFEILSQLIDKSLIQMDEHDDQVRYRMLETIRQYAHEKLEPAQTAAAHNRHRDYFLALAENGEPHLRDAHQSLWLNRFETEHGNLIAALDWAEATQDTDSALRLGGALWWFWNVRGYWSEGRARLAKLLAMPNVSASPNAQVRVMVGMAFLSLFQGDYTSAHTLLTSSLAIGKTIDTTRENALALYGLGAIAQSKGDYAQAVTLYQEGLALFRVLDDRWGIASALNNLGTVNVYQDKMAEAEPLFESSLSAFREIGDSRNIAKVLSNMGIISYYRGDFAHARQLYQEALAMHRQDRDEFAITVQLENLGYVALHLNEYDQARAFFQESLTLLAKIKSKRNIADVFYGIAALAAAENNPTRAARLFGAGEALYRALGAHVEVVNQAEYDQGVAMARSQIDSVTFDRLCDEGRRMLLDQAIAYALQ